MKLPAWIAGGADVSRLAYDLVVRALDAEDMTPSVVAAALDVDEADVLRAMAELQAAGVLALPEATR